MSALRIAPIKLLVVVGVTPYIAGLGVSFSASYPKPTISSCLASALLRVETLNPSTNSKP